MPELFRVILAHTVFLDLENIARYIHESSPQNAADMAEAILAGIDSLAMMPNRFRMVGKSRKRNSSIRAMLIYPFIVYYRIDEAAFAVYILNILHGAQRQPRRF